MKKIFSNLDSLGKKIAGVLLLVLGITVAVLLAINAFQDLPLWVLGKTVDGVIEEKWYELIEPEEGDESGELTFTYHLRYSFTTPEGERLEGVSSLSAYEWSALVEGGKVRVVYSSIDPGNNRVDDSRFRPMLACMYIPFAFLAWLFLSQGWELLTEEIVLNKVDLWRIEKKEEQVPE
jgi:hypothetical protein